MSLSRAFLNQNDNTIDKRLSETIELIRKESHKYKDFLLVPLKYDESKQIQGGIVVKALNKSEAENLATHYFHNLNVHYRILEINKVD